MSGGLTFVNSQMKGIASFEAANFLVEPPRFFGAKLHEGTDWHGVQWPRRSPSANDAVGFVNCYERLKLEMDRLKKHEDELNFFALEMRSRRVLYGNWRAIPKVTLFGRTIHFSFDIPALTFAPKPRRLLGRTFRFPALTLPEWKASLYLPSAGLLIGHYGLLCDYGRSYVRPFFGLLLTVVVGTLAFWHHSAFHSAFHKALSLSVANTFGVLGFRKDFVSPEAMKPLSNILVAIAGVQTMAGAILLFLLGLAIRNRLRMR
jgi:hypothetical protein